MKDKILKELYEHQENHISGEYLRKKLNVSRTAVWKQIQSLKEEGYVIETMSRKGYRLLEQRDEILPGGVKFNLNTREIGKEIKYFDTIDSTNTYSKTIALEVPHGTIVMSDEQVGGRGRLGRNWSSPKGEGIWMSLILKPGIPPNEGMKVSHIAAAAVCKGIREITGLEALVKWPNDIVINGKKVCGILTEVAGELNEIHYLIVGIGINVNNIDFPTELEEKASSLLIEGKKKYDRKELIVKIISIFEKFYDSFIKEGSLEEVLRLCRQYSALIGREVVIIKGGSQEAAKVLGMTDEGFLEVELSDGRIEHIFSGEVSVRGQGTYV
ncbi:biotin--acetyl-CoA-carboxylase ligase [Alkaliphilus metalliredigens QYMF]|uniref:Bifunctional ligase/repressor BirA n=1 Tax=Alkaliphilus metalliredigens (strain QYMF) TaxID=293826 RepID=A6TWN8_ALKMQ|nr:biotin--[acetyl-CoA-carboxylase] ligase [Alkaliphilus metalliredigens]ABR50606.1 biotin--acetyl-CoA-carboxylase ligase [Alkaliphilus metalliredigens QYMF]